MLLGIPALDRAPEEQLEKLEDLGGLAVLDWDPGQTAAVGSARDDEAEPPQCAVVGPTNEAEHGGQLGT